jgi:hypothetical protein
MGGWDSTREEFTHILKETITTPKYLLLHIHKGLEAGLSQFFQFDTGDAPRLGKHDAAHIVMKDYTWKEFRQFEISKQQTGRLSFTELNKDQHIFVWISFAWILFALWYPAFQSKIPSELKAFIALLFITLLINAFITGSMSTVVPRYQSRLIWMVPFVALLLLLTLIRKENIRNFIDKLFHTEKF